MNWMFRVQLNWSGMRTNRTARNDQKMPKRRRRDGTMCVSRSTLLSRLRFAISFRQIAAAAVSQQHTVLWGGSQMRSTSFYLFMCGKRIAHRTGKYLHLIYGSSLKWLFSDSVLCWFRWCGRCTASVLRVFTNHVRRMELYASWIRTFNARESRWITFTLDRTFFFARPSKHTSLHLSNISASGGSDSYLFRLISLFSIIIFRLSSFCILVLRLQ